jgi:hypothetical protein
VLQKEKEGFGFLPLPVGPFKSQLQNAHDSRRGKEEKFLMVELDTLSKKKSF